ncbi:hypothetical protein [Jannaschia formosa]|uniref:hypothetical protein n=1 Tax=Jannaschia formosa TaxID=2259592 RepID=UPI000E1BA091|nr:hypothetical protein [Jannaschia formosa]TFL19424.1 hypothetical protein DR046_05755 [Jannaschia formosa]
MRHLLLLAPFLLAACQTAEPEPVVDDAAIALATRCLAEVGQELAPGTDLNASVRLTPEQQAAFEACVAREAS